MILTSYLSLIIPSSLQIHINTCNLFYVSPSDDLSNTKTALKYIIATSRSAITQLPQISLLAMEQNTVRL